MRILFPSIVDPARFPGGAGTATRGIVSLLEAAPLAAAVNVLPSHVPRDRKRHALRRLTRAAASLTSPLPAKVLFQRSNAYVSFVRRELARQNYDLVMINGTDLVWIMDLVSSAVPIVVCAHNIEHELYADQLASMGLPAPLRGLLARDLAKLKKLEIDGLQRADGTLFLSSQEAERMRPHLCRREPLSMPPIFDYPLRARAFRHRSGGIIELSFLANLDWWPNREGLNWFLEEVLPECGENVRLHLYGVGSERYASAPPGHRRSRVVGHGYLDNLADVWDRCDVMICPIRAGGGVNIKLAESIYNGMPVLTTPFAIQGLPIDEGPAVVVRGSTESWIEFLTSPALHDLAHAEVSEEQRNRFESQRWREPMQAYLEQVVAEGPRPRGAS